MSTESNDEGKIASATPPADIASATPPAGIDRRLHRLHDGDLSAEERVALEKEIAGDPALGKKLEGLREVSAVVHAARTEGAGEIDSEALWKAIEGRLGSSADAAETPAAKPALRAIQGGAAHAPAAPPEDARARRRRYIGIGVGVFAIAAAALLMIYGPPDAAPDTIAETTPELTTPDPIAPIEDEPETTASATDYTEVLAVDFGTNVGTIFAVEGEGGQRYAVVWLDDVLKHDEGDLPDVPATPD